MVAVLRARIVELEAAMGAAGVRDGDGGAEGGEGGAVVEFSKGERVLYR